mgnify:CR=1 FL=1
MRNGIFPAPRALLAFSLPFFVLLFGFLNAVFVPIGFALDGLAALVMVIDFVVSPRYKKKLLLTLDVPRILTLHSANRFTVTVENTDHAPVAFRLLLDFDTSFDRAYDSVLMRAAARERRTVELSLFTRRRGTFTAHELYLKGRSILGFWSYFRRRTIDLTVKVPPFIEPVNQVFKVTQKKLKQNEGLQRSAYAGAGRDFEMLKDYVKGDDVNLIDWKATARLRKPISRVYRLENTMEVALLVDCGRIMGTEVNGMSLLDYAANAALILSVAAVKNYDSVSLLCFGSGVTKYVPPIRTKKEISKFQLVLSEIDFEQVEPDYREALRVAGEKLPKRSIILIFTDIIDDSNITIFHHYLSVLKKKHIVIMILIRDNNLFQTATGTVSERLSVYTKAAAADLVLRRNKTVHSLRRLGVDVLDLAPEDVSAKILNRYLELKTRN